MERLTTDLRLLDTSVLNEILLCDLIMDVVKAWKHSVLVRESVALRQEREVRLGFEGIIGESRPMEQVFTLTRRVAPTDGTVFPEHVLACCRPHLSIILRVSLSF